MKKTKFIGIVNGVEYNNVADYNTAINEAMKTGVVNASTRTETVDNEPEEVHDLSEVVKEPVKTFVGVVNGVEYDTVEAYNDAVNNAINSGVTVNAHTETRIENSNMRCMTNDENFYPQFEEYPNNEKTECEDETDYFPYFNEDDDLYLNVLATEDMDADCQAMKVCDNYLKECKIQILDNLKTFENTELVDYLNSIEEVLGEIKDDYDNSNKVQDQIESRMQDRRNKMDKLAADQEEDAKKLEVLNRGYKAMQVFRQFYEDIKKNVFMENKSREACKCDDGCCVTTCEEKEPQKEQMIYTTDELKSAVKTLMERLFGK